MGPVSNGVDSSERSEQSGQSSVYSGIAGAHRAIMLRPYGREGLQTCQAGSLGATREPGGFLGSAYLCGVFFRRIRSTECQKTYERGAKRTEILGMGCSIPRLTQWKESSACRFNRRLLLVHNRSFVSAHIDVYSAAPYCTEAW
jgi:hypothetical protein